jgi:NAD(P)-dependent dehydrogenase (short-subunit alcohol dehydrogenase family)
MRRIAVTGAASGIGLATARRLREAGWAVVAVDRVDAPRDACDDFVRVDLTEREDVDRALTRLLAEPLHGLVNAAGVPGSLPPDVVADVNVLALRHLTDTLLPQLERGGVIVNIASTAGAGWRARIDLWRDFLDTMTWDEGRKWFAARGWDGPTTYDRGKEAVIVLSQQRALERFATDRVRVCTVSPGATQTPILGDFYDTMDVALLDAIRVATGRDAVPEEIASAVGFLVSERAGWVNGVDLHVDGGGEAGLATGTIRVRS